MSKLNFLLGAGVMILIIAMLLELTDLEMKLNFMEKEMLFLHTHNGEPPA